VHSVLSHRRPTARSRKLTLVVSILCGLLVAGGVVAPLALASAGSWCVVGPNRTIYAGQSAGLYANTGAGSLSTAGMTIAIHQQTAKGWTAIGFRKTDAHGKSSFNVTPRATTVYRIALLGNSKVSTSYSKPIRITVSSRGLAVVAEAAKHRGKPYRYGAAGPMAFDCSGYTQYVYKHFGRVLPHSATQQSRYGYAVAKGSAQLGDLILFGSSGRYYHAAIYAGGGYMWDSSTYGHPVAKRRIYSQGYIVRRVV
jgi:cell wall-associated NlpC family hydrolase